MRLIRENKPFLFFSISFLLLLFSIGGELLIKYKFRGLQAGDSCFFVSTQNINFITITISFIFGLA